MQAAQEWYRAEQDERHFTLAREAFEKAQSIFDNLITQDPRKRALAKESTSIADLENTVKNAKARYEGKHKDDRVFKWLTRISHRVRYYGNIGDVLVQQYPEYTSLAWGAFKLLFILVENQEDLVATLAKGLSQVADALPHVELSTILYPTQRMKEAVAQIYANIMNFLIRAKDWYEEGKLRHIINAFARPAKLRYDDIIQSIELCTKEIDRLSTAGARAEQRDIHLELQTLRQRQEDAAQREQECRMILMEIRQLCVSSQSLQSTSFLDTNKRLTDLQINQIMENLVQARKLDPLKSLQLCDHAYGTSSSAKNRSRGLSNSPLWIHPKFASWKSFKTSNIIMIKGAYKGRGEVKSFAVNTVKFLRQEKIPVIWSLKSPHGTTEQRVSAIDVLKDLVCQVLRLNISLHTERVAALSCAQFRAAESLDDWFNLLASLLDNIPILFIVIDMEAVSVEFAKTTGNLSWLSSFSNIFQDLSKRRIASKLKVLLVSYGSATLQEPMLAHFPDLVISTRQYVKTPVAGRLNRPKLSGKGGRHLR